MSFFQIFAFFACASVALMAFPLEWNPNFRTDTPYEVDIDRSKLAALAEVDAKADFAVTAIVDGKSQELPVLLLKGKNENFVSLRFSVPAGTTALECIPLANTKAPVEAPENLFANALTADAPGVWEHQEETLSEFTPKGLLVSMKNWGKQVSAYTVPIPREATGRHARLELGYTSLSKRVSSLRFEIRQLDAEGNVLFNSVVDPRWISYMAPTNREIQFSEIGYIRPDTVQLSFTMFQEANEVGYDNDGQPIKDPEGYKGSVILSRLALRTAEVLPFPKYNDTFFGEGVSEQTGDCALSLRNGTVFGYVTRPQATWAEAHQVTNPRETFFPDADGTIEAWFKPEWDATPAGKKTLFQSFNYKVSRNRGQLHALFYDTATQELSFYLKDKENKEWQGAVNVALPDRQWTHLALQWSATSGVKLFLNGKAIIDRPDFLYAGIDISKDSPTPNAIAAVAFAVGNTVYAMRGHPQNGDSSGHYSGLVDSLRVTAGARYEGDFMPERRFTMDDATHALFNFDRDFDGVCAFGSIIVPGSINSKRGIVTHVLKHDGKEYQWTPNEIVPENNPRNVLSALNYPIIPMPQDFRVARTEKEITFEAVKPGDVLETTFGESAKQMGIVIKNTSDSVPLVNPLVLNEGELDSRSFQGLANAFQNNEATDRERVDKVFNFVLGASDYFMNHTAQFPMGSDVPKNVEHDALIMLNGYCGFECGPLNNMAANLFTTALKCPASQNGGYGHSFEGVYYDGKTHVYDLSAQQFFPSFDNMTAASLGEVDRETGIVGRTSGFDADPFARLTTRMYWTELPIYQPKIGFTLNPGERIWIKRFNEGYVNDLQCSYIIEKEKYMARKHIVQDETGATPDQYNIYQVNRFFPDYSNASLIFDGKPSAKNPAFSHITTDSFCYNVRILYPIVAAQYQAVGTDGQAVPLEISTDNGKTFRPLDDTNGMLVYPVRARMQYLIKINAAIDEIQHFKAETIVQMNPRLLTGRLKPGKNKLTFLADDGESASVQLKYATDSEPCDIEGGVYSGSIPGFERQLVVMEPNTVSRLPFSAPENTAVTAEIENVLPEYAAAPVEVKIQDDTLVIKSNPVNEPTFATIALILNGKNGVAKRNLTIFVAQGARFVTAANAEAVKDAEFVKANDSDTVQDCIRLNKFNSECVFRFPTLPQGRYSIWLLDRFVSQGLNADIRMRMPKGVNDVVVGHAFNLSCDFKRSVFGQPGKRSRFKWDYFFDSRDWPFLLDCVELPSCDSLSFYNASSWTKPTEIAAVLIIPEPSEETVRNMIQVLCSLNRASWK